MGSIEEIKEENTPFVQLLMLCFYAFLGLFVFLAIGFAVIYLKYGGSLVQNMDWLSSTEASYLPAQRILITAQQIGLFLVPALLLAKIEGGRINGFYGFKRPDAGLLLLVLLMMAGALPLLEWVTQLNQKMSFPAALKGVENWMKAAEDQGMKMTIALLKMENIGMFLLNIGMIALLPAVAEELMFRAGLQRIFGRMFNNPHLAIWFSAFVFSAIHMQFYGFLPRLLLGATFGYIYFWSGSLWYAIFGHFLNNAYAVCAAWYMQKNNIPLSEADKTMDIAWYGYVISVGLTFLLFRYFKKQTQ
ncbi:CPBP family intramembrane glutamic endopeptidase [Pedobacter heparinus]|uniref:Abortive infection protein n=1 Tax=Pedobacter heparinus (strain ATCC 13125 / DSM 2366 / CIP 104194 / JCM 7457 / NBRC 12017 / NCIMB 9290 / NRRL B-14731 / HIM 762-3) TaxID=485917 RepID=C6XXJ1_PEDHD|nr:CPBP family intramembrane glutamic endopeptidase [Pedobacter heparinus]ACU02245.1 Abortive infection protein [Pedobacter heparinus DSM 2366]